MDLSGRISIHNPYAITHSFVTIASAEVRQIGNIPGELELDAVDFRKAVTQLCLAVRRRADTPLIYRDRCASIVQKAGRYSMLLIPGEHGKNLKSMSPTILREVAMRNITIIEDILAIAQIRVVILNDLMARSYKEAG
jgi:hypothetical protein